MKRRVLVGPLLLALTAALAGSASAGSKATTSGGSASDRIAGSYIVVLKDGAKSGSVAADHARRYGADVSHVYRAALKGYSARMSDQAAARIAQSPAVQWVEADRVVTATAQSVPTGIDRIDGELSSTVSGDGSGSVDVDVAVIDTGIDTTHPDLNVVGGKNCSTGTSYKDGHGHGSHVAGTIAAKDDANGVVGVAPGARLWAVRVLNNAGSGSTSSVVCGIDWVTANASTIEVANMSLGGAARTTATAATATTTQSTRPSAVRWGPESPMQWRRATTTSTRKDSSLPLTTRSSQ